MYAENYEWYLPIEGWLYLGPTSAGAYLYSGGGGAPNISHIDPPSGTYGQGDGWGASGGYIQIYGSNLDRDGATCLPWVSFGSCYWASDDGTQVNLYYDGSTPPGTYPIEIELEDGVYSNQTTFTINGDPTPSISSINPSTWQAGTTVSFTISGSGFGSNPTVQYSCCSDGVSYSTLSDSEIDGTIAVDPSSPAGTLTVMITSNGYNGYSFQGGQQGQSNQATAQVTVAALTPALTQSPTSLNLSTGDTVQSGTPKYIAVSISPNTVNFASTFNTTLYQDPNSSCDAVFAFSGSGTSPVNSLVTVPAAQSTCSGVFSATAYYPSLSGPIYSSASTTVTVPPQAILLQMYGETSGQYDSITQIPELSVASAGENRFAYSSQTYLFNGVSTWQQLIVSGQVKNRGLPTNGQEPELDNAVAIFTGAVGDIVGGGTCYWSPSNAEYAILQTALSTGSTSYPSGLLDPQCFTYGSNPFGSTTQVVLKSSMPLNIRSDAGGFNLAPAFVFERRRSPTDPFVTTVP